MKKGFTFIEVLVVVAIIGILSMVVLASLNGAKIDPKTQGTVGTLLLQGEYPEPTNYAVDTAGVLSQEQLDSLNAKLKAMDNDKHQFGVAIVKTTAPLEMPEYAIKLAEKWKVGKADLDNGAIIVIATEDRQVRIEVGYGLEGDITDATAGRILDNDMVPHLKKGDWYQAIVAGLDALNNKVQ